MDVVATLDAPHEPERVWEVVSDLGTYPTWLDIVPKARPAGDAWVVDLRGRFGPFARSKRLRMVRTVADAPSLVVFERDEDDGRQHSPWVLRAEVMGSTTGSGSTLTMRLHYGGSLWGPVLERLLGDTIERSRGRLLEVLSSSP